MMNKQAAKAMPEPRSLIFTRLCRSGYFDVVRPAGKMPEVSVVITY